MSHFNSKISISSTPPYFGLIFQVKIDLYLNSIEKIPDVPLMYCTNVKWRILEPEDILLSRIHIQNTLNPVSGLVYCIVHTVHN